MQLKPGQQTSRRTKPSTPERFSYLTAFDPGHASIIWPEKNGNATQLNQHLSELQSIVRFDLLWRPHVLVRHVDLFNNLTLARFVTSPDGRALVEAGLVRVSAPFHDSFQNLFLHWALKGAHQAAQHWHHLTLSEQSTYDEAHRAGKVRDLTGIEELAKFREHGFQLRQLLATYDGLFEKSNFVILPDMPGVSDLYATRVLGRWYEYVYDKRQAGDPAAAQLDRIEKELLRGADGAWRRSQFFTNFERIEQEFRGKALNAYRALEAEVKIAVLNAAFYDEFEAYPVDYPGPGDIAAVRDLSLLWRGNELSPPATVQNRHEPLFSVEMAPLRLIQSLDIASFHNDSAFRDFQESVAKVHELLLDTTIPGEKEISNTIRHHLQVLNACAKETLARRGHNEFIEDSVAEVFLGIDPRMASVDARALQAVFPNAIVATMNMLFSIIISVKTAAHGWRQLEAVLKEQIYAELPLARDGENVVT